MSFGPTRVWLFFPDSATVASQCCNQPWAFHFEGAQASLGLGPRVGERFQRSRLEGNGTTPIFLARTPAQANERDRIRGMPHSFRLLGGSLLGLSWTLVTFGVWTVLVALNCVVACFGQSTQELRRVSLCKQSLPSAMTFCMLGFSSFSLPKTMDGSMMPRPEDPAPAVPGLNLQIQYLDAPCTNKFRILFINRQA